MIRERSRMQDSSETVEETAKKEVRMNVANG